MIALVAIVLGLALGTIAGGSIRRLETSSLRFEWLVLILFIVQAVARGRIAGAGASSLGIAVWVLGCIGLLGLLAPDWRQPGIWVVCVGVALNIFVVLLNGGMPVVAEGQVMAAEVAGSVVRSMGFYQLAGPGTLMAVLGDVVPLAFGAYRILVSPGDLLLALGITVFMVEVMVHRHEPSAT